MKKVIVLVLSLFILTGCSIEIKGSSYEYVDLNNNKGNAKDCWSNYGNLSCDLYDGTRIKVMSYKRIDSD